jgi:hypothetical protein
MPIIPALGRLRQDHELEASLGYILRPCLKKTEKGTKIEKNIQNTKDTHTHTHTEQGTRNSGLYL